jgi:hypothetical protein
LLSKAGVGALDQIHAQQLQPKTRMELLMFLDEAFEKKRVVHSFQ